MYCNFYSTLIIRKLQIYETVKNKHHERWTKGIRNWSLKDSVLESEASSEGFK